MIQNEEMQIIEEAFGSIHCPIPVDALDKFYMYQRLLLDWNQKINLISRQDEHRIITRHFLESAGLITKFNFSSDVPIIDIGTGAGFPGLPVKILCPDLKLLLVESRKKKALFLEEAINILDLKNVSVLPIRIETMDPPDKKIICISRAVASMEQLFQWSEHLFHPKEGELIAMKGPKIKDEILTFNKRFPDIFIQSQSYNPFPKVYPLDDHYLGVIRL